MAGVKLTHPALGEVEIPQQWLDTMSNAEINRRLVEDTAKKFKEEGVELSTFDTFTGQVAREITSTSRGIQERITGDRTTTHKDDFIAEVAMELNPASAWSGLIVGAVLDPVTFLNPLAKASRIARIAGGTAVGATAGFLTPIREELGESTAITTGTGAALQGTLTAISPTLGKIAGAVAQKLGYKSEKELQEAFKEATPEERKSLQEQVQEEAEALNGMGARGREADAKQAELDRISNVGDEFLAEQQAAKDADVESIKQVGRDAELENIRKVADDFAAEQEVKAKEDARTEAITELEKRIKSTFGGDSRDVQSQQVKANNRLRAAQKQLEKIRTGATKAGTERIEQLEAKVAKEQEEVDFLRNKRDVYKQRASDVKELVKLKKGKETPRLKELLTQKLGSLQTKAEQPTVEAPQPQAQPVQEAVQDTPLISPEAVGQRSTKSVGARQASILETPTGAQEAAKMSTTSNRAMDLPKPAGVGGELPMTRAEEVRRSGTQQSDVEQQTNWRYNIDDADGKQTFSRMFDAAEDKEYFVKAEINEGNYRDYVDWLADEFESSGKILSPAAKLVAARVYAMAGERLARLNTEFRRVSRGGEVSGEGIDMLQQMQVDGELHKAMDEMRNIQRIGEADRRNTSAALRSFKLANELQKRAQQDLRDGYVNRLFFGVDC